GAPGGVGAAVVGDPGRGGDAGPGDDRGAATSHEVGQGGRPGGQIPVRSRPLGGGPGCVTDRHHLRASTVYSPPGPEGSCAHTTSSESARRRASAARPEWVIAIASGSSATSRSAGGTSAGTRTSGSSWPR